MAAKKRTPRPMPKELVTYLCKRCAWNFTRTEEGKPRCSMCGKGDRLTEVCREPLTPEALQVGLMRSVDRLMSNLQKAYEAREGEWRSDGEELLMLEALAKGKDLEQHVKKAFAPKKSKRIHVASMSL